MLKVRYMSFDDEFPGAHSGREIEPGLTKTGTVANCFVCRQLTSWFEANFQAFFCSRTCLNSHWEDFMLLNGNEIVLEEEPTSKPFGRVIKFRR